MVRAVVCASAVVLASFLAGCSGHDASVGDNDGASTLQLQTKKDGAATGDGATCSWADTTTYETCASPSTPIPTYRLGDEFKSIDGCNECECTDKGIMCTVRQCNGPGNVAPPYAGAPDGPACTADAKKCPDGSYVGRSGPNCAFDPCGGGDMPIACDSSQRICNDGSSAKRPPDSCEQICPEDSAPIACQDDAKQCPDGSYVGRTGPKCEFSPCPGKK